MSTSAARVVLVSNDEQLRSLLCGLLIAHGYAGAVAIDTRAALAPRGPLSRWDIAVIDTSVSYGDAIRTLQALKDAGIATVAIFAARSAPRELRGSADVLLAKPFDPRELLLVIRGMVEAGVDAAPRAEATVSAGPMTLSPLLNQAIVASTAIELTGVETRVLYELMINVSQPVTRERLMRRALLREALPDSRGLDTHMKRLRRKIGTDRCGRTPIRTIRGVGYLLLEHWEPRS